MNESITWVLDGSFPADGVLVLIEIALFDNSGRQEGTEVTAGFVDGEIWRCVDAVPLQHVVSWADMPKGTRGVR